jgi:putative sterol carrier protein
MSAFMNGKIKVEGDMSALLALQNAPPTPEARAVMERLRAMTA